MTRGTTRIIDDPKGNPVLHRALRRALDDVPSAAELEALLAAACPDPPDGAPPSASPTGSGGGSSLGAAVKLGAVALAGGAAVVGALMLSGESATRAPQAPASHSAGNAVVQRGDSTSASPVAPGASAVPTAADGGRAERSVERSSKRPSTQVKSGVQREPASPVGDDPRKTADEARPTPSEQPTPPVTERATTELGLLSEAERLLSVDASRALELAERHRSEFPSGRLVQEREVIAIEALVRLGRHERANERFSSFEKRFAGSVHRPRLEQLLRK